MEKKKTKSNPWIQAREVLKKGGIVVLPTDTIYGVVGSALSCKTVENIYKVKDRIENKPFIILINSYKQLDIFGIDINKEQAKILKKFWPGKVSIILPCHCSKWKYLHKGVQSMAFRMIGNKNQKLFNLIKQVGPLVAPSANKEGCRPSENIREAKEYFKDKVDLYINGGTRKSLPSTLIKIKGDGFIILREGKKQI